MTDKLSEDHVEQTDLDWSNKLGYQVLRGSDISSDSYHRQHAAHDNVLIDRFRTTFQAISPILNGGTCEHILRKPHQLYFLNTIEENRRLHRLIAL